MARDHPLKVFRETQTPPLTQEQLAKLINVNRVVLTRWEGRKRPIPPEKLPQIAAATGIAPATLRPDLVGYLKFPEAAE